MLRQRAAVNLIPATVAGRRLALSVLVTTIGNGAFITTSVLYFTRSVGFSPITVGLGLTIAGIAGLLAGVPFGHLADVAGPRRVAAILTAAAGLCVLGYLLTGPVWSFVLVAVLFALADRGAYAARQALTGSLFSGPELVTTRAYLRTVTNIGVTLGAALGAVVIQVDTRAAYSAALVVDGLSFLCSAAIITRVPQGRGPRERPKARDWHRVLHDRRYVALATANMLMVLHAPLIEVILPLWVTLRTDVPRPVAAILVLVNTVGVVLLQVRLSRRIDTLDRSAVAIRVAGLMLAGACLAFWAAGQAPLWLALAALFIGCICHLLGEIVQASAAWVVSYDMAPAQHLGQYQGLFNTGSAAATSLAPAALILLLVEWAGPGWLVLAGIFLAAAAWYSRLISASMRADSRG